MFKNYLKVALRNLWKNKAFSAINIIGLATGLAVCLLIVLFVMDELSYDRYNVNADRIYRVDADIAFNGTTFNASVTPEPLAATLLREYPQVESIARLNYQSGIRVKKDNQNIQDHNAVFADSTFFKVFTVPMVHGNPVTALSSPKSIVITETTAKRYFNSTDVVGKSLYIDNSVWCKVTGVIKDLPQQSHFHFNFIRPLIDSWRGNANEWLSNNWHSYILVKPGVTRADLQGYVNAITKKYVYAQLETQFHAAKGDIENGANHFRFPVMPLTDIHLHSDKSYEIEANGNITYVYIFSVIAVFILLIACVNFMNLSTARSANRAKEVGIRKVSGSTKLHLVIQFLTESVLLSFFSLLLALVLTLALLNFFNQLAGKHIYFSALLSSWLLPVSVLLVLVVGCVAGSYPAFYLSSFEPIHVLKGKIAAGFKRSWLRSSLVVFQFSISIVLIISTIVIYNQLSYIRSRDIGYNRNQVLVLHDTYVLDKNIQTFRQELMGIAGVKNATISGDLPTGGGFDQEGWFRNQELDAKRVNIFTTFYVDKNYVPTLGMQMVKGRNFSDNFPTDSTGLIINEAAVQVLGLKDPINTYMYRPGDNNKAIAFHVIGVVKDFNYNSMHEKISPMFLQLGENTGSMAVRIETKNIPTLIDAVQAKWQSMSPGQPFSYTFMDNDFNNLYNADQHTGKLFISFAVFAIFIACLGLFGLVTYAAEQRTKEIGIRKVLGAGIGGIVTMLSKDFAKLVLFASLISFPIAWWAMHQWLQGFAYRVTISWWVFVVAGVLAIMIALLTVSYRALKAALANPVKSLRTE
ncbi:MAG TPA: ABC transporter permease [Chitinophagaceae bacterium]|nr:ABC transporter permease [Chitinophagaceae bacterium]